MINVVWMVPPDTNIAHGSRGADLDAGVPGVTALRMRGTWPVDELREDELVGRCRPCQLAATELERAADNESP